MLTGDKLFESVTRPSHVYIRTSPVYHHRFCSKCCSLGDLGKGGVGDEEQHFPGQLCLFSRELYLPRDSQVLAVVNLQFCGTVDSWLCIHYRKPFPEGLDKYAFLFLKFFSFFSDYYIFKFIFYS